MNFESEILASKRRARIVELDLALLSARSRAKVLERLPVIFESHGALPLEELLSLAGEGFVTFRTLDEYAVQAKELKPLETWVSGE